jgi:hypothetical protein
MMKFRYSATCYVISQLSEGVIKPAEEWIAARKAQLLNGGKTEREVQLERENAELRKLLQEK